MFAKRAGRMRVSTLGVWQLQQVGSMARAGLSGVAEHESADYHRERTEALEAYAAKSGKPVYKEVEARSHTLVELRAQYEESLGPGEKASADDPQVRVVGRIRAKREASKKLVFYDIESEGGRVQVMSSLSNYHDGEAYQRDHGVLRRGDVVAVHGVAGKSKLGELSVLPERIDLLAPCLHLLPAASEDKLADPDLRFRQRHRDFLVNEERRNVLVARAQLISGMRRFLENDGFLEVETPMLQGVASGAAARPFVTQHTALHRDMQLRVAPELYLKQLIVGGFPRVFEIGKQFRNEGIDSNHNPEFTTMELYQSYADYNDLMALTEKLLAHLAHEVEPSTEELRQQLQAPFQRVSFVDAIESKLESTLLSSEEWQAVSRAGGDVRSATRRLQEMCASVGQPSGDVTSVPQLLDRLVGTLVEPDCTQPTFVVDHPLCLSPLARAHPDRPHLAQRFELMIQGMEVANAYSELNDPGEQRLRFRQQQGYADDDDDDEVVLPDEDFCRVLEYAMPPTAGLGIGIDRLVMLFTGQRHIREVMAFPALRELPTASGGNAALQAGQTDTDASGERAM